MEGKKERREGEGIEGKRQEGEGNARGGEDNGEEVMCH